MSAGEEPIACLRERLEPAHAHMDVAEARPPANLADRGLAPAAVLAPLVWRPDGLAVLFTVRASHLRRHAGQISFPGGRLEPDDPGLAAAALREAHEEIGLAPGDVELLGRYEAVETGTGYHITPFVGLIPPDFQPRPDPSEVAETFEVPFAFLMDAANHFRRPREWRGSTFLTYEMPYAGRRIWGVTAELLRSLHNRLYAHGAAT